MRPLIEYITREWNTDFWMAFLSKIRQREHVDRFSPVTDKSNLLAAVFGMIRMFKVLFKVAPPLTLYAADTDHFYSSGLLRT